MVMNKTVGDKCCVNDKIVCLHGLSNKEMLGDFCEDCEEFKRVMRELADDDTASEEGIRDVLAGKDPSWPHFKKKYKG